MSDTAAAPSVAAPAPEVPTAPENTQPAETPAQAEARRFKVKVNGAELDVDEKELIQGYQTRKAADEKFREAAAARKQAEEFISMMKGGQFFDVAKKLGLDPRELSEKYLMEMLEEESLEPREKELRDLKKQVAKQQEAEKKVKEAEEEQQKAALAERYTQEYTTDIVSALQTGGLPKTEHTVRRMAYYMHQGLQRGIDLKAADVVDFVKQDYAEEQRALYASLDGDDLVRLLGEDIPKKIRDYDLSKLKTSPRPPMVKSDSSEPRRTKSPKITKDEWRAKLAKFKNEE